MIPDLKLIPDILRDIDGFASLDDNVLQQFIAQSELQEIPRGTALISEGEAADTLYIALSGRFVVLAGGTPIAEITAGEPIGELAFFAGGTRTASVVAERSSSVLELSRTAYDALTQTTPALANAILGALSRRLAKAVPSAPRLQPRAGAVTCVLPGGGQRLSQAFVDGLSKVLGDTPILTVQDLSLIHI